MLPRSRDDVEGIQRSGVTRGQRPQPSVALRVLGVGQKAVGHGHQYATVLDDVERRTVEWVGVRWEKEAPDGFFRSLTAELRASIAAVDRDVGGPFLASIHEHLPGVEGTRTLDPFPIAGHMNEAVTDARKRERPLLSPEGWSPAGGTGGRSVYGRKNLPEKHREGGKHSALRPDRRALLVDR